MKIKKKWRKILQIGLTVTITVICFVYIGLIKSKSDSFNQQKVCSNVIVNIEDEENRTLITDKEIIEILKKKEISPIGNSISTIKTKQIEDILQQHPVVKVVQCYKSPNGNLMIDVEQRNLVLRVVGAMNYYIDSDCERVPTSDKYTAYVPVITGAVTQKMIQEEIFDFVRFLKKNKFWDNQIVQIHINDKKEIELVPRVGDHTIKLGKLTRYKSKLDKLETFYKKGLGQIGWKKYRVIDIRFRNQVVCR